MKTPFRKGLVRAVLCASFVFFSTNARAQNGLIREVYNNVSGGIAGLLSNPNYPGNPAVNEIISEFETPANIGSNYGQRVRGYVVAPETGEYVFWIASDDQSQLFLSNSENPQGRTKIAEVLGAVGARQWELEGNQRSVPITLQKGQRYYIEALMVEGSGDDHLAVRWRLPDGTIEEPIPNERLLAELIPPQISRQPQNVVANEGENATLSIQFANRAPVAVQWFRNDSAIPGATNTTLVVPAVRVADSGTRFYVHATNSLSTNIVTSATAFLTVRPDVVQPTVVTAQTGAENDLVTVSFSESIDAATIANLANFEVLGGPRVIGASLDARGTTAILRTTPMTFGSSYTLLLNNLRDRAATPNAIEPDTTIDFSYGYSALPTGQVYGKIERPGPSTRRTGLVISEIMYHPAPRTDGRNLEFVEIYNSQEFIESLDGYRLAGAIDYTFPAGTFISARSYLVVAANPVDLQVAYGLARAFGPFTNNLPDSGTVRLLNDQGALLLEVPYRPEAPWPVAADGAGPSLTLTRASYGEADPRAWSASQFIGGTPGRGETAGEDSYTGLVINEMLTHTDLPQVDFVELYNYSTREIDLSDAYLTDDISTNKFRIPKGTRVPALGFVSFTETQLGFALSAAGEKIILRNPQTTRVIDAVSFGAQANGVSLGRFPDGNPVLRQLAQPTPGAANSGVRLPEVVINEIMFNPVSKNQDEEFVELFNRTGQAMNLRGWRLQDGISFTIAQDVTIPPFGYLVIAKNAALLRANHTNLTSANVIGNFNGTLSNSGERIAVERPESLVVTNGAKIETNLVYVTVDEVTYGSGGRWPHWADGGGSSLELIDPNSDNDDPSNWADSDESAKSEWITIERRGLLDWGSTNFAPTSPSRNLHVIMMDEGEAMLDNVQVFRDGGANLVSNPGFENGLRDWLAGGTHESSTVESAGRNSANGLHIRAAARGDTAANRLRVRLTGGLTNGEIATLRADVRWLRGTPEILLRLHGNYLEAPGVMPLPRNLGTPGAANSRSVANSGPAIENVQHAPVLPIANQPVTVIAEIADPDRVALAMLRYRVDRTNAPAGYVGVPMSYNGAGFYSAVIPGQAAGTGVAFYIEALDSRGAQSRFPSEAPERECVIMFGDLNPTGNFGTYHLWLTQTNINRWRLREQASNKALDATFVYNDERVIYNMGALYSGSPFHWRGYNGPLGNGANYLMQMPDDDLFLGQNDFVLNLPSNIGSDSTGVREQVVYWMADQVNQPFTHRRYVHVRLNGVNRDAGSIFEDAQQPNRDFIRQWFPNDDNGELYKIEDWFEYSDTFSFVNYDARLKAYYTRNVTNNQPELKRELYRWWFRKRAVRDSAHDYSELFRLVQAANNPNEADFVAQVQSLIDVDEWMGAIALRHAVSDWDAFGYSRGKNMYAYKPENGKWQLLHWDIAFSLGLGDSEVNSIYDTIDEVTVRMMNTPVFRRAYLRAIYEIANGPMTASRVSSILDARYRGLVANGIAVTPPESVKSWIASRRDYLLAQVNTVSSGFGITSNNGNNFTTNRNTLVLTGSAPVNVRTIRINGENYPIEWTSINTWRTRVALKPGQNAIRAEGFDANGQAIPSASSTLTVTLTGQGESIAGRVLFNEIFADAEFPQTEFVELHNTARITSFDLSGYRINGVDFTFPAGSVIAPGGFLVVARDPVGFGERFGFSMPIAGVFKGALDNNGETLSLISPGTNGTNIAEIRFDGQAPWPALSAGSSWQLIDPGQDPTRVGNWAAFPGAATPGGTNSVRGTLAPFPTVWINEVQPVNVNGLADSAGDRDPWVEIYNSGTTSVSLSGMYLTDDAGNPMKWGFPIGGSVAAGQRLVVWLDGEGAESTGTEWHANFRLAPTNSLVALVGLQRGAPTVFDYLRFGQVAAGQSYGAYPEGQAVRRETFFKASGGSANDLSTPPVRVTINEWMASNTSTIQDPDDLDFDDWFELYNAGTAAADLSGYSLSDDLANWSKFTIPAGTIIPPGGYLLVWADEERSTNGQLHVNFKLSQSGEAIGLFAPDGSAIDSITFGAQTDNVSQGRSPDGGAQIVSFNRATPGASNVGSVDPNALRFTGLAMSQGQFVLTWNSESGATYRLEAKNSLNDPSWSTVRTITATGTVTSANDPLSANNRFYRVVKQP